MADHARYAKPADVRRNVQPGEIFTYWPQAKVAAEMGCSERQVRRGVRSLREAGALEVRRRVRPCEASYVWVQPVRSDVRSDGDACVLSDVRSGVLSGVRSHTEPRTEPQKNHVGSSRAREEPRQTCPDCGQDLAGRVRDDLPSVRRIIRDGTPARAGDDRGRGAELLRARPQLPAVSHPRAGTR